MGLASTMAALGAAGAGANATRPSAQGGSYPGQQAGQSSYPGQPQYQAYGGQPGGQQGYGQQQQNAVPPNQAHTGGPVQNASVYTDLLNQGLREKGLNPQMFPKLNINAIASAAPGLVGQLSQEWQVPSELLPDLANLALYDVVIFIDNSGSMRFEENGERIKDLELVLNRIASAATKFDTDGVSLRFMNRQNLGIPLDNIRNPQDIERLIGRGGQGGAVQFTGLTPLGSELRAQVIDPMVMGPLRRRNLPKPLLVVVITDGQPAGESRDTLKNVIAQTMRESEAVYGRGAQAVSFQIAQVGNDQAATRFLAELDDDPQVGSIVDCTSNYEVESAEFAKVAELKRIPPPFNFMPPEIWLMKLLLGGISRKYDNKDEQKDTPAPSYGQSSQAPYPQQNYPQGQQGYQQPNSQQGYAYNRPPPNPPYPQQGNQGYPQQGNPGYPPQGNQGYPPQGNQGYPGQQGPYGGPQGSGGYPYQGNPGAPPPPKRW